MVDDSHGGQYCTSLCYRVCKFMFDITTKNGHGLSPLAVLKNTDLLSLRGRSLCMKGNVQVLPMQECRYLFACPLGVYNNEFDITSKNGHGLSLIALLENGDLLSLKGRI